MRLNGDQFAFWINRLDRDIAFGLGLELERDQASKYLTLLDVARDALAAKIEAAARASSPPVPLEVAQ